jgi:hypothetical protein
MLISGTWHVCDDGVIRPVMRGEIQTREGSWIKAPLLLDTGADRTVLSADILQALHFQPIVTESQTWWSRGRGACACYRNPHSADS